MKKHLSLLPMLALSVAACSQNTPESNVPSVVQNAFKSKFPLATAVEWEKKPDGYEADFMLGKQELEARVSATGQVLSVKHEIQQTELPLTIAQSVNAGFSGYKIDEAERVEYQGNTYYQIELEKWLSEKKVVYTPEGEIASGVSYQD